MKIPNFIKHIKLLSLDGVLILYAFFLWDCVGEESRVEHGKNDSVPGLITSEQSPEEILVDDFDQWRSRNVIYYKRKNSLGHYQGTWAKRPSYTLISKSETQRRGDHGKGLILTYHKTDGWCGWYTLLGGLDATKLNTLSFWVKGDVGGERFDIGFLDTEREEFEVDAVYAGPVQQFMEGEVSKEWKEVIVPLSRVRTEINLSKLAAIILWFRYEGTGTIYIEDMKFKDTPHIAEHEESNFPRATVDVEHPRSLWIWKVDPIINPKAADDIFKVCQYASIEVINLFLGDFEDNQEKHYRKNLKKFLGECKTKGITVNMVNGHPTWGLQENHDKVITWLKAVLEYNQNVSENDRFGGIVLDIEPYLIEEWTTDKDRFKEENLRLLQRCREILDSYSDQNITLSSAVPVFYKDEGDFVQKILQLTDYLTLMDYFDTAPALISNADFFLDLASNLKKKIRIAAEVQDIFGMSQGTRRNTFFEEGWEYMEGELKKVREAYHNHSGFDGFDIHCYYAYRLLQREMTIPQNRLRLEKTQEEVYRINTYKIKSLITVDGKLDEWSLYPPLELHEKSNVVYGQHTWKGSEDLNFKTYSAWDEESLYFAFDVTDDNHSVNDKGRELWKGDHIELWLDADLGDDFTESTKSKDDFQFGFSPGNFTNIKPEVFLWTPNLTQIDTQKVDVAAAKTGYGYTLEVAIPRDVLYNNETVLMSMTDVVYSQSMHTGREVWYTQKKEGTPPLQFFEGYRMGISIEASDTDDVELPQKCLMSSSLNRIWGDPTTFGFLEFKGLIEKEQLNEKITLDKTLTKPPMEDEDTSDRNILPKASPADEHASMSEIARKNIGELEKESIAKVPLRPEEAVQTLIMLDDIPEFQKGTKLTGAETEFARRGRTGSFQLGANKATASIVSGGFFDPSNDKITNEPDFLIKHADTKAIKFEYQKKKSKGFCGSYIIINGDLSGIGTLTFLIRGAKGGEAFELGMHDMVSNRREDAVFCGSIYRYLPQGITTDWQLVKVPLADFYGMDITKIFSLVFHYDEPGNGKFWIDEIRFSNYDLVSREMAINKKGYFLLNDFDHSDLNLLGRKTSTYKKLPSYCVGKRLEPSYFGGKGRSLQLSYKKANSGWCGFYTLLNQIDGEFYDLSKYHSVSFMVKGEKGGENFEIGMADKRWILIGDSLKAGKITKYLPGGVTTDWQKVTVPLKDFGKLDLSQMGSFVINFHEKEKGIITIDDIKFHF